MTWQILNTVDILFRIIEYIILARVIVSWLPISRDNQFIRIIFMLTEPILGPIRNIIQKSSIGANMMFDLSPIVAILLLMVIRSIVFGIVR